MTSGAKRYIAAVITAVLAALPVAGQGPVAPPATRAAAATYTNPIIDRDLPDPAVIEANGAYWMTHTMGGPDEGWPLYRSDDLVHWRFDRHLLTPANKGAWMQNDFWAPEIHRVGAHWVLTFTARSRETGHLCIGIATAPSIGGPYAVQPAPLVSDTVAVLDSHLFQDGDGSIYLLWKRDSDAGRGVGGAIFARRMNAAGTEFAPGSPTIKLLEGSESAKDPAAAWERGLVEAPWMVKRGGYYYLFYSGAFIDTSYALGVARSTSPTGPFTRCPGNPILRSNAAWGGPGHGAFLKDRAGVEWHLYHARHQARPDYGRVQLLDRLYWTGDWPAFGDGGTPSASPQPAPQVRPSRLRSVPVSSASGRGSQPQNLLEAP